LARSEIKHHFQQNDPPGQGVGVGRKRIGRKIDRPIGPYIQEINGAEFESGFPFTYPEFRRGIGKKVLQVGVALTLLPGKVILARQFKLQIG
jgi:hypothetical protein